jgi:hypothetical protein
MLSLNPRFGFGDEIVVAVVVVVVDDNSCFVLLNIRSRSLRLVSRLELC